MAARSYLCLDPGERQLRAVSVVVDGTSVLVERALLADVPGNVLAPDGDESDVDALGRWIAETLRRAGFPSGSPETIITLDREQATIRRISLPTDDPDELTEMARLAMLRETPVEAGTLVVDLVPRESDGTNTTVLIAAAPGGIVDRAKRLGIAIGHPGARVSLRAFGMARLLSDGPRSGTAGGERDAVTATGLLAGFDTSGEAFELLVLRDGELLHSRGVHTANETGDHAATLSEAKRSWLGYRLSQPNESLGRAVLFAPDSAAGALKAALERVLGTTLEPYTPPAAIRVAAGVDREALGLTWPLIGLALEHGAAEETINLASPRRAPDLAARRRLRFLVAGGVLTLAGLLGWTVGNLSRQSFATEVETLNELATSQLPEFHRFRRDENKLAHLRTWESAEPEWLEEARIIHGFAPDTTKVVFDSFVATLKASDVQVDRDRNWKILANLEIAVSGEAKDRATADAFRDVLVEYGRYALTSHGADTEGGRRLASPFLYTLWAKAGAQAESGKGKATANPKPEAKPNAGQEAGK